MLLVGWLARYKKNKNKNKKNKNKNPHLIFHRREDTRGLKFGKQTLLTMISSRKGEGS